MTPHAHNMDLGMFALSAYHYHLPQDLIAQHPVAARDSSRLMIIDRSSGNIEEVPFAALYDILSAGDALILNDTRVIPARLLGKRSHGGEAEILLNRPLGDNLWEAMARPGKKLKPGCVVVFGDDFACEIVATLEGGSKVVRLLFGGSAHAPNALDDMLAKYGQLALPHYIQREQVHSQDLERYQTIYAKHPGAIAAPTAGLHFTRELLDRLAAKGVQEMSVTLHVGPGTFRPVQVEDIRQHAMHKERCSIPDSTAQLLNAPRRGAKQLCVGTTACRAIESAADESGLVHPGDYDTQIFIYPGYRFKRVEALLTNFHLPGSSLLMLVSALAGYELIKEAYAKAVAERFRFFSYGDAMLIL